MDRLSGFFFSHWLNKTETKAVNAHQLRNFTYIKYANVQDPSKELFGRLNKVTNEVMWADQAPLIGFKCTWILSLGIPVDFVVRELFYLAKLVVSCADLVLKTITCKESITNFPRALCKIVAEDVSNMARVGFYLTGMTFAALGGIIIDPLRARKRIGLIAQKLNQGVTVSEYRKMLKDKKEKNPNYSFIKCMQSFYVAECMQPWVSNLQKNEWITIKVSDSYNEVVVKKEIKECPCARWAIFPLLPGCV
jgi:hypothetical protein